MPYRLLFAAAMALAAPTLADTPPPPASMATEQVLDRAWQGLGMEPLLPVIRDEALVQADEMAAIMFEDGGSPGWRLAVGRLHDPAAMGAVLREALGQALAAADPAQIGAAMDFYDSDLGRRMVGLELSARAAIVDPDAEAGARAALDHAMAMGSPRLALIDQLIARADLTERNVAGALNAALAFAQGFQAGGGYPQDMSEQQLLADTWSQEAEIRDETLAWTRAFMLLAYSPVSDDDLRRYTDFAGSPEGQAMADAVFAGFDTLFRGLSYQMGLAAAAELQGRRL